MVMVGRCCHCSTDCNQIAFWGSTYDDVDSGTQPFRPIPSGYKAVQVDGNTPRVDYEEIGTLFCGIAQDGTVNLPDINTAAYLLSKNGTIVVLAGDVDGFSWDTTASDEVNDFFIDLRSKLRTNDVAPLTTADTTNFNELLGFGQFIGRFVTPREDPLGYQSRGVLSFSSGSVAAALVTSNDNRNLAVAEANDSGYLLLVERSILTDPDVPGGVAFDYPGNEQLWKNIIQKTICGQPTLCIPCSNLEFDPESWLVSFSSGISTTFTDLTSSFQYTGVTPGFPISDQSDYYVDFSRKKADVTYFNDGFELLRARGTTGTVYPPGSPLACIWGQSKRDIDTLKFYSGVGAQFINGQFYQGCPPPQAPEVQETISYDTTLDEGYFPWGGVERGVLDPSFNDPTDPCNTPTCSGNGTAFCAKPNRGFNVVLRFYQNQNPQNPQEVLIRLTVSMFNSWILHQWGQRQINGDYIHTANGGISTRVDNNCGWNPLNSVQVNERDNFIAGLPGPLYTGYLPGAGAYPMFWEKTVDCDDVDLTTPQVLELKSMPQYGTVWADYWGVTWPQYATVVAQ